MSAMASQITGVTIVYWTVCSGAHQRKSKLRVTGLCEGNSPVTGEFPAQKASNAENISIWWRHHDDVLHFLSLTITACDMADQYPTSYKFVAVPYSPDWCISLKCKGIWHAAVYYSESFPGKILIQSTLSILRSITWYFMGHKYVICGVGNFHRPANPRPTTLEEDRELFLLIFLQFYVYGLRFKAWGPTTFLTEFQTLLICRK